MQIVINNKPYEIFCGTGEEESVSIAATNLNQRIDAIKKITPHVNQEMLLLMAALTLQDEYSELSASKSEPNEEISEALDSISGYVEKLAMSLK
jgi:cell division protein ZapA (FtsZ GTPase activity inhibitor)